MKTNNALNLSNYACSLHLFDDTIINTTSLNDAFNIFTGVYPKWLIKCEFPVEIVQEIIIFLFMYTEYLHILHIDTGVKRGAHFIAGELLKKYHRLCHNVGDSYKRYNMAMFIYINGRFLYNAFYGKKFSI